MGLEWCGCRLLGRGLETWGSAPPLVLLHMLRYSFKLGLLSVISKSCLSLEKSEIE